MSNGPSSHDHVAIIGMAVRLPGGLDNPTALWAALMEGRDLIQTVPPDRWRAETFHGPLADTGAGPGIQHASRRGGFLRDVDQFDAAFFGISPRDADTMDPAQRVLLEVAWQCWEDAGIPPTKGEGRRVGVFVGGFTQDYQLLQLGDPSNIVATSHTATGVLQTLLSNRISHALRFTGPSMTIDTACSSSLVALDLAVNSLRRGECDMAMVGAAQLQLVPHYTTIESVGGFLSPSGRCRAFDHRADGYVRAESVGMLLLAPLDRAVREGWPIHAVVAGTAVNHNGRVPGITLPDADAQARVVAAALDRAGITPDEVGYVEAHGTGTRAGDRAEAAALGRVFGQRGAPLWIGSIKTNLGHAEAAAGMNGLIKAVLCLQHHRIPPHLHWEKSPEGVDLEALGLRLPATAQPWPEGAPYAGVSSFGFGGANAHAILAPAPDRAACPAYESPHASTLFVSGPTWSHVFDQVGAIRQALDQPAISDSEVAEMAAATLYQREHLSHRLHLSGRSRTDFLAACDAYLKSPDDGHWIRGEAGAGRGLAWIFSGMGPQWPAMGAGLATCFPVYREALQDYDSRFAELSGYSLLQAGGETGELPTRLAQPLSIFVQMALCTLLDSWGVSPDVLMGHSVGEIAAFQQAGMIDLDTAVALAYHRSRLQDRLSGTGGMLAVRGSETEVREWITAFDNLDVAAVNASGSVTVSGPASAVRSLAEKLSSRKIYCRALPVTIAFHSAMMDPLEQEFREAIAALRFRRPNRRLYSTVTGARIDDKLGDTPFADYWWRNLRAPVAFQAAVETAVMDSDKAAVFQEIGATPALLNYVSDVPGAVGVATLKRNVFDDLAMLECLGQLHALGFSPRWRELIPTPRRRAAIPGAVWRRNSHWSESGSMRIHRLRPMDHPLLGWPSDSSSTWENTLAPAPGWDWMDHRILGRARAPGALFLEIMGAAWRRVAGGQTVLLTQIRFQGVTLAEGSQARIRTVADIETGRLCIYDRSVQGAKVVSAFATTALSSVAQPMSVASAANGAWSRDWTGDHYYTALRRIGFDYGPSFRGIERIRFSSTAGRAEINGTAIPGLAFPPAVLDAALQAMLFTEVLALEGREDIGSDRMPQEIGEARFYGAVSAESFPLRADASLTHRDESETIGDVTLTDQAGVVLAILRGVTLRVIAARSALAGNLQPHNAIHTRAWVPCGDRISDSHNRSAEAEAKRTWMILDNQEALGLALIDWLKARGERVVKEAGPQRLPAGAIIIDFRAIGTSAVPGHEDQAALSGIIANLRELCQELAAPSRLWIITSGAFSENTQCRPLQRAVWSLACAIGEAEHADIFGGIVDLDLPLCGPRDWRAQLHDLAVGSRPETQFRIDSNGRLTVPKLVRCPKQALPVPFLLRRDGTYLITGGFGALGRHAAELFARSGAGSIVLIGRTSLPARQCWDQTQPPSLARRIAWIRRLETFGARITTIASDMGSQGASAALAQALSAEGLSPVRGILHAAGIMSDKAFVSMADEEAQKVLGPKVTGTIELLQAVHLQELDFVLLYSSIASMMPAYGQAVYAGANGYLDGIATWLCQQGVPAQSISWGPWTVGMAQASAAVMRSQGLRPISPFEGSQLLTLGLGLKSPQFLCAGIDWETLARRRPKSHWFFSDFIDREQKGIQFHTPKASLKTLDRKQRAIAILERLSAIAAGVTRSDPGALSRHTVLTRIGVDSLIAVEIQGKVAAEIGADIAVAELLTDEPLGSLAERMASRIA